MAQISRKEPGIKSVKHTKKLFVHQSVQSLSRPEVARFPFLLYGL